MRRHLLTLLALLVLLMQPAALLHGLSHLQGGPHGGHGGHGVATTVLQDDAAGHEHGNPSGLDCLQCLAFAALGSAALPAALLLFRAPLLRHALAGGRERALRGGTGAGYHARGPPALA